MFQVKGDLIRATGGSVGYDLKCLKTVKLGPGERQLVGTGVHLNLPSGVMGLIRDRSGLACRGITTRGGVIDWDYRDEVKVILVNESQVEVVLEGGSRIAQIIYLQVLFGESDGIRTGGFGSTGV